MAGKLTKVDHRDRNKTHIAIPKKPSSIKNTSIGDQRKYKPVWKAKTTTKPPTYHKHSSFGKNVGSGNRFDGIKPKLESQKPFHKINSINKEKNEKGNELATINRNTRNRIKTVHGSLSLNLEGLKDNGTPPGDRLIINFPFMKKINPTRTNDKKSNLPKPVKTATPKKKIRNGKITNFVDHDPLNDSRIKSLKKTFHQTTPLLNSAVKTRVNYPTTKIPTRSSSIWSSNDHQFYVASLEAFDEDIPTTSLPRKKSPLEYLESQVFRSESLDDDLKHFFKNSGSLIKSILAGTNITTRSPDLKMVRGRVPVKLKNQLTQNFEKSQTENKKKLASVKDSKRLINPRRSFSVRYLPVDNDP